MREIKFRAKEIATNEWVIGSLNPQGNEVSLAVFFACIQTGRFDAETSGQHTGLKDKNGKEIYEGDIVRAEFGIGTIEYGEISKAPEYHFDTGHDELWLHCCKNSVLEVIGNIYKNPELLEGASPSVKGKRVRNE